MRAFLDFEASSLAKASYPVEVAWVFEDGRSESHLIKPLPAWTDWDDRAAAIHGILRSTLEADGKPVEWVALRLLEVLTNHETYASSPSWDGKWLSVLLRAGGLPRHALRLRDTDEAQYEAAVAALAPIFTGEQLDAAAKTVIERVRASVADASIAHRALPDAEYERQLWIAVQLEAQREAQRLGGGVC